MPWLCVGDYNEILSSDEKQGCLPRPPRPMEEFCQALLHCGLSNLVFIGNIFTWRNGRLGRAFVLERLDRACANTEWREIYPFTRVHDLHAAYFDHEPILITTQEVTQVTGRRRKLKRFKERWTSDLACEGVIREAWERVNLITSPMYQLFEKIKACRMALVRWSRTLDNFKEQIELKYTELEALIFMNLAKNQG
ncbi:hypothetical protein SO802_015324 [Lithocarpus litseifolius]|uniref:Reverse transcriptase n=1 Tax=Lithocarpus litseifolius TaxID=425828 RepID=A0AAW2CVG5_9ROSI